MNQLDILQCELERLHNLTSSLAAKKSVFSKEVFRVHLSTIAKLETRINNLKRAYGGTTNRIS